METKIKGLRTRIDQMTIMIVNGLKDRSRFLLNTGVFTEEFCNGRTWFEHRLYRDQCVDSEFGRFEFPDQYPILQSRSELDKPKIYRKIPESNIFEVNIDVKDRIIDLYKHMLPLLCEKGENRSDYGDTSKCDANNIILYNARVSGIGRFVAASKLTENPYIVDLSSDEEIKSMLIDRKREDDVIKDALKFEKRLEINKPELVKDFFRKLIDLTVDVQVEYVKKAGHRYLKD